MSDTSNLPDGASREIVAETALQRVRDAIISGLPNGKRLLELRRIEAAIGEAERLVRDILTAAPRERVDAAFGSVMTASWSVLDGGPLGDPAALQRLYAFWFSGNMPEARRHAFDRFLSASVLRDRLRARPLDPASPPDLREPSPDIPARLDVLTDFLRVAVETNDPRHLDATLILVLAAQRRALAIPDGPQAGPRLQALASAYAGDMPPPERSLYERGMTAIALQFRLRGAHPELLRPEPPPTEAETGLVAFLDERIPALQEAQAHTVPGKITGEWLDRLAGLLKQCEETLAATPAENRQRPRLCYYMASAAWALGRGREQKLQPKAAREAYARSAELYEEAADADNAAAAHEKAVALGHALLADVDGGSFDDLRNVAKGIADPFDRAAALGRLSAQATQANDHFGAKQYADAAALALAEAKFPDPSGEPIDAVISGWVDAAASRKKGNETLRLLQRVGDLALLILQARHTATIMTDPAGARTLEAALERFPRALVRLLRQSRPVTTEIHEGLKPYIDLPDPQDDDDDSLLDALRKLTADITTLDLLAKGAPEPPPTATGQAISLLAQAEEFGEPGPIARARLVQAALRQRAGDLDGAEAAALAGEAALLPDGGGAEQLVDRGMFDAFLMLRGRRCDIAATKKASERVLDLSEGAIRAIEADRYRINDPFQQGRFLTDRTHFYTLAAVAALKLERWDSLIEVAELLKSRAALRGRLAAAPDQSVADLARQVAEDTAAIEAAIEAGAPERIEALRKHRRQLWSLLSMARMRSSAGQTPPTLTLSAVQAALGEDEAVVSWLWLSDDVLLTLAIDGTRVHAERSILTQAQKEALATHIEQFRPGNYILVNSMGTNVRPVTEAMLPPATRDFIASAKRLIFSPHRSLHLVPVHAARFDGRFLIERASVRYAPNLGSLLMPWSGAETGAMVSVGIDKFGRGLTALENAEAEASAVAAAWAAQGFVTKKLIGPDATRRAFIGLDLAACRCLHLATHGESVYATELEGDPFASRLCFADGDLEALSLAQLPLRADVVVMSACNSGQRALALPGGSDLPGDDLFGLQATLFQAGVRSVIGALWTVDDDSAAIILPELHRRLAGGARPEQALQGALCAYLQAPETSKAISYWAPLFMSSMGRMSAPRPGAMS